MEKLEDWEFSNYPEWIGSRNGILFDNQLLINQFGDSRTYQKYIENFDNHEIVNYLFNHKT